MRKLLFLLLIVMSAALVVAQLGTQAHNPNTFWWNNGVPTNLYTVYEFANSQPELLITSTGDNEIQNILINYNGINALTANDVLSPSNQYINLVTASSIDLNSTVTRPRLDIVASSVNSDTDFTWDIRTTDDVGVANSSSITLHVLNDAIAPRYSLNSPTTFSIIQPGQTLFDITAIELESGLNTAELYYDYYSAVTTSAFVNTVPLSCNPTCQSTQNLQPTGGQNYVGFSFNITDNAANFNETQQYWLYLDTVAPEVTLNAPQDGTATNSNASFFYNVGDATFSIDSRFNPQVTCNIIIGATTIPSGTATTNGSQSRLVNDLTQFGLTDGQHSWNVQCSDSAGYSTTSSSRTFTLDSTGPQITLNSPAQNTPLAQSSTINLDVVDALSNVDTVWYSLNNGANTTLAAPYDISTATWPADTNNLVVYANDSLGNLAQGSFTFIIDTAAPLVLLTTPLNNSFNNNVFTFTSTDNYATTTSCELLVDGSNTATTTTTAQQGQATTFNANLAEGTHTWRVRCTDVVGNVATTASRTVTIDTTLPIITLTTPTDNTNSNGISNFNYSVIEANMQSGTCLLFLNGTQVQQAVGAANFTSQIIAPSNSAHQWHINCTDAAGNSAISLPRNIYFDAIQPTITNVTSSLVSTESFTISWNTTESTTNSVYYGVNASQLDQTQVAPTQSTTPSLAISGLSSSTLYFFVSQSCDQFNNCQNSSTYNETTTSPVVQTSSGGSSGGGGGSRSNRAACNDRRDNDGDGLIDNNDPGCNGASDDDESDPITTSLACVENWNCLEWSACDNGQQTRICQDWSLCGTNNNRPEETRSCEPELETQEEAQIATTSSDSNNGGNFLTGAFTTVGNGVKGNSKTIGLISLLLILLGLGIWQRGRIISGALFVASYKTRKRKQEEAKIRDQLRKGGLI